MHCGAVRTLLLIEVQEKLAGCFLNTNLVSHYKLCAPSRVYRREYIAKFTDHVFAKAISQIAEWQASGLHLSVAVKISALALTDSSLAARLSALLDEYHVAPEDFTVEVTETSSLADYEASARTLRSIADIGIGISIDDFGTGYTSIGYLKEFPVSELKIDRLFIKDILESERDLSIVSGMIQLAKGVGAPTVAEGVDDIATLQALIDLGCDYAQGLYLCHPSAASNFTPDCREEIFKFPCDPTKTVFGTYPSRATTPILNRTITASGS